MSVSPDELLFAAQEVAKLLGSTLRHDILVHDRLRAVIQEHQRSAMRDLFEDKIASRLPGVLGRDAATAAPAPVTAADLRKAGLTLEALVAKDASLTGKALVLAGVIRSHAHLGDVGIRTFADMIKFVGPPHQLARWLYEATGGSDQAWRTDFLPQLKFDFGAWLQTRHLLTPDDLTFLNFHLGAHLDASPRELALARAETDTWLTTVPREQWVRVKHPQLREDQYELLIRRA
jgi:hypothetical protein